MSITKIEYINQLADLMREQKLQSIEIKQGDDQIRLEREYAQVVMQPEQIVSPSVAQPDASPVTAIRGDEISSPMVGIFYTSKSPSDPPLVSVGDRVKAGQVLCVIEAMKFFNEITAETEGVITEICVKNGDLVEFGQTLFRVE